MAQESIDYFIQMAKDYAKAEKELEVQHWVFVNFERKDESNNYVRLSVMIYHVKFTNIESG